MSAVLPSRFASAACQQLVDPVIIEYLPDSQSTQQLSRPGKPRRRLSVWYWRALYRAQMASERRIMACGRGYRKVLLCYV